MVENFLSVIIVAITLEGIVSYAKMIVTDKKIQWQIILTIILGIFLAIAYKLDALATVGVVSTIPMIGQILTGICMSRGSNYVFDWIGKISHPEYNKEGSI